MKNANTSTAPVSGDLAQWLKHLESIHPSAIDLGLNRVKAVADNLGLDFSDKTVIIVGGTNGKGTTCRFLELACQQQKKTTGVYSSPHLLCYTERVRINGEPAAAAAFCQAFNQIESTRGDITLTYFEFSTLAALLLMQQHNTEVLILEVGLGGRLDATNIIDADLAVITTIDLDHQDWLGNTREAIAREKAGIMRAHKKAVIGELVPPSSLKEEVSRLEVDALWATKDYRFTQTQNWQWQNDSHCFSQLPEPHIPRQNIATALAALHHLGWLPAEKQVHSLIRKTTMPGRLQTVRDEPRVVVDVGHNPQAVRAMVSWLQSQQYMRLHLVAGMLKDKSIEATLAEFSGSPALWYLGSTAGPRGAKAQTLLETLEDEQQSQASCFEEVAMAYQAALSKATKDDLILVFGSFLTVAEIMRYESDTNI
ncbi:bifunctional tetrahydrofolate synthase/dihydrofolate synthase [Salinimonas marina]|uniref:Dihydrofolate synthase/folylpolyglutamate synthase n=1 Tax=Salinimonas marina TaxID=2785918 RepID=A0A7S9DZA6_9ALTE|nr:bifunctional tetrahydrofolate synthase/dihydrofolate synthase [Salinimonas marina]QPG06687.1 bifunctional tetrahydrofolate synthase/dihydrofolate synthase [Salinimonas marina]